MGYTAEIFTLGNELLIGRTVDKNATDIALHLTKEGIQVDRITTARDDLYAATSVLQEILSRKPDIICITGGLGPTFDDIQLEIVANAIGSELELNQRALSMIESRYKQINKARKKMAFLPKGATPLENKVGSAPGSFITSDGILIFSMPGVPREMKSILSNEVLPKIRKKLNLEQKMIEFGFDSRGARESDISEIINKVRTEFPEINFKSHPKKDDGGYYLSLHTYQVTDDISRVENACIRLKEEIAEQFDVTTTKVKPVFDEDFDPE